MKVLLSIKPEYADSIFNGEKGFEYRRAIFKQPVRRVIVYVSAPVQRVIGEFEIEELLSDEIGRLWKRTKHHSGISKDVFYSYFSDKEIGYAIKIGKVTKYRKAKPLSHIYDSPPPQSFAYIVN